MQAEPEAGAVGVLATAAQAATNPSFRVRVSQLAGPLSALGCDVAESPLLSPGEDERFRAGGAAAKVAVALGARRRLLAEARSSRAATAWIQKQADFLPSMSLEEAVGRGRRLVYDVDDAIWLDGSANGHRLGWLKGSARKARRLAERADAVVAGNDLLAEHLSRYSDDVTVVPSLVDTDRIEPRRHEQADELVLGWIGSPATAPYLEELRGSLTDLARAMPGTPLVLDLVGGGMEGVEGMDVRAAPWSPAEERAALGRMDIGLMPMPDTPWTRGKCAYKALLYMAGGVPVVAPDVGITGEAVGGGGLIAGGGAAWVEAVRSLAEDPALRGKLGAAGRDRAEERFSIRRWAPELARILRGGSA